MVTKIKRRGKRRFRKKPSRGQARRIFRGDDFATGFSRDRAELLLQMTHWPDRADDIEHVTRYVERFIRQDEHIVGYDPISTPSSDHGQLPHQLCDVLQDLSTKNSMQQSLLDELDDDTAQTLWSQIEHRARELSVLEQHPSWGDLSTLSAWELFEVIVIIVAEGMTYTKGMMGSDLNFEVTSGASWFEGVELFLVSLFKVFTTDLRSVLWLAKQPFKRGFSGMCRHYSLLVQTLFLAAKRVLKIHDHTHVLTISGTHEFLVKYDHAWTWFVDTQQGLLIPVDLTGADWLYDRQMADSIFNTGFDAYRFNNTSAFLHSMTYPLATSAQRDDEAYTDRLNRTQAIFQAMIDPKTVHGQALLLNWMRQNLFPTDIHARISAFLRARDTDRALTSLLDAADSAWFIQRSRTVIDPTPFHQILDGIEVD